MKHKEIYSSFFSEDEWIDLLILIENQKYIEAISFFRSNTGFNLIQGGKMIKLIAKEELDKDILTFIHND